ncbi:ATP-binding protein [Nocardiopsis sp. N85]|uniref:ATP-binding protein n=1 Tax=Nocardiopsis sp. N85 TaxID=3029400 RepID=UPI00237F6F25|nr:ATP-binding protein [Nocardiopsis sp. N85]MDE3724766.1 ATP-binding protein [Nocardiopsis sp. N85]
MSGNSDEKRPSQATLLIEMADRHVDVVAGADGKIYAVRRGGPRIAFPLLRKDGLRPQLARRYYDEHHSVPSQSALTDAISVLEGRAMDQDPQDIHLRLATHRAESGAQVVVIDLGTPDGRCVVAGPDGWHITDQSPVLFRRTKLTSPMSEPGPAGQTDRGLAALRGLLNVDEPSFRLIVGWMVAGLMPDLPHPILGGKGEQGTGKSTALEMLINLLDPSPAALRSLPRDIKTWATVASASWAVCLDNVSTIPMWLSDTLCKAVTGDGLVDRALYSDDDVSVLSFRRLIALTSIDTGALASDLSERMLTVEFLPIKKEQRRPHNEIAAAYARDAPAIRAALLDLLCRVLAELPSTHLAELPRMADFARILGALDTVMGWNTLDTYLTASQVTTADLLDAKPFTSAVADFVDEQGEWTGSISQLLDLLAAPDPRPRSWPVDATRASGQLKRDAPVLRSIGITVTEAGRSQDRHRRQLYTFTAHTLDREPPHTEPALAAAVNSANALFSAFGTGSGGAEATNTDSAASALASLQNPSSRGMAETAGSAEAVFTQLSNQAPASMEEGPCVRCRAAFRRFEVTDHPKVCTSCARHARRT